MAVTLSPEIMQDLSMIS